ncbi:MAG TPA: methylated-DNA--[protein]-cysteine S-methyltransferase [Lentimicrobium sp.]|nr:methylated-DNA--[protein]-cysteine S-methyltransferase [Lentimicrobium sp.]
MEQDTRLLVKEFHTPLGVMTAGTTNNGLCLLDFKSTRSEASIKELEKIYGTKAVEGSNDYTVIAEKELNEYLNNQRREFTVRLDTPGTEFQQKVWNGLKLIPFGQTITYEKYTAKLEIPLAIRAVAHAIASNRILILVPCHRVVGKGGSLRGYAGGLDRKRKLLDLECGGSLFSLEE